MRINLDKWVTRAFSLGHRGSDSCLANDANASETRASWTTSWTWLAAMTNSCSNLSQSLLGIYSNRFRF